MAWRLPQPGSLLLPARVMPMTRDSTPMRRMKSDWSSVQAQGQRSGCQGVLCAVWSLLEAVHCSAERGQRHARPTDSRTTEQLRTPVAQACRFQHTCEKI